jgi:hypothetical protein
MSTENQNTNDTTTTTADTPSTQTTDSTTSTTQGTQQGNTQDQDMIANLVAQQVSEQLKDIKSKLDKAYSVRDDAISKAEILERKEREATLKKLEEEGKHKEVFDMKLVEKDAAYNDLLGKYNALEQNNLQLTRDSQVRDLLRGTEFRNDKAGDMAFHEVIGQVVKDDKGNWVHRSGVSIKDFITAFVSDEANSFLLKPKVSSGGGTTTTTTSKGNTSKSLFEMTQEEVLKMAADGKLPSR